MQSVSTTAEPDSVNDPASVPAPASKRRTNPALWIPTLYFAESLPYSTIAVVAAFMYKNLGVSNTDVALYTTSLAVPYTFKFAWAPLMEMFGTKKHWVIAMQWLVGLMLAGIAFSLHLPAFMSITLAFFSVMSFFGATHDIAADGAYMATTSAKEQAAWVGIQGFCWNAGKIVVTGFLVTLTGYLFEYKLGGAKGEAAAIEAWQYAWMIVMLVLAVLMGVLGLWHTKFLAADQRVFKAPSSFGEGLKTFWMTLLSFFQKKGIWLGLAFILLYRSGEGFIEKIGPLFMIDAIEKGGLGLSNQAVGTINGTFGTLGFMVGTLLGGMFAAKMTLKRSIVILALAMNVPHVCYVILAATHTHSLVTVATLVTIEKFGFGFGFVASILYMMQQIAPGKYRTAHYAFATSIMGAGALLPSWASGYIQEKLGYQQFFIFCLVMSVPSVIAAWLAPFHVKDDEVPNVAKAAGH